MEVKYEHELTDKDRTHLRVTGKLDSLNNTAYHVIIGFIIFWALWGLAVVWAFGHFTGLYW